MKSFIKFENLHTYDSYICEKIKEVINLGGDYVIVTIKNITVSMVVMLADLYHSLGYNINYDINKNSTTFKIKWC